MRSLSHQARKCGLIHPVRDRALPRSTVPTGEEWPAAVLVGDAIAFTDDVFVENFVRFLGEDDLSLVFVATLQACIRLRAIDELQRPSVGIVVTEIERTDAGSTGACVTNDLEERMGASPIVLH